MIFISYNCLKNSSKISLNYLYFSIYYCFFSNLYGSDEGGAIFSQLTNTNYSIFSSIFNSCRSTSKGGGIYLINSIYSQIKKNCFFNCSSFWCSCIEHNQLINGISLFNESSSLKCPDSILINNRWIWIFRYGICLINSLNSSFNKISDWGTCIAISFMNSSNINYLTIINNQGDLAFAASLGTNIIFKFINIVNNTGYLNQRGSIYIETIFDIYYLIHINNNYHSTFTIVYPNYINLFNCFFKNIVGNIVGITFKSGCVTTGITSTNHLSLFYSRFFQFFFF